MVTRSDRSKPPATSTTLTDPAVIHPTAVYSLADAARLLGLRKNCLPREVRLGRLRVSKRAGRYFVLGQWLLEWVAGGELRRPAESADRAAG